jgi:CRISPR-associated protein Cas2
MQRCYLVCYDICDPKRLHRVYQLMRGYGEHWQLPVFLCKLDGVDRVKMQSDLHAEIDHCEDQVLILDLGPNEETARKAFTSVGGPLPPPTQGIVVF